MATLRQLIETRIANANLGFKEVAGAADMSAAISSRLSVPCCYVFRSNNSPKSAHGDSVIIQEREESIACLVITRNVRDARGSDSSDENEALCKKVQDVLLGWQPDQLYLPMEQSGGRLVNFKDGFFVWLDTYKTTSQIRSI